MSNLRGRSSLMSLISLSLFLAQCIIALVARIRDAVPPRAAAAAPHFFRAARAGGHTQVKFINGEFPCYFEILYWKDFNII